MTDDVDAPSPWSSDGVPASPPTVFVWDDGVGPSTALDASVDEPSDTDAGHEGRGGAPWRRPFGIGAIAVVAIIVIGFIVWPRGDEKESPETAPAVSDAPETTLDTLPARVDESDGAGDDAGSTGGPAEPDSIVERVDLPPAVAAIASPTELVVQTLDQRVHTISLPSGNVRTVDLGTPISGDGFGGGNLVAGPDAAMFASYDSPPFIIPRSGVPIEVDRAQFGTDPVPEQITPFGWVTNDSGEALFVVAAYEQSTDTQRSFLVSADGSRVVPSPTTISNFDFPISVQGVQIVNDAGGAYRLAIDGAAQRMTDGTVIAASQTDVLIRRCDESRNCVFILRPVDARDGAPEERVVDIPDSLGSRYFGLSLSPDGTAVAFTQYGPDPQRMIVELDGGDTITSAAGDFGAEGAWARDGSGQFTSTNGPGVTFLDRASGDSFVFGAALGQVTAIAARYPDSELVETSIPAAAIGYSTPVQGEIGIDVVTTGKIGALSLVDLDAATSSSWNAPSTPGSGPARLFADGAQVLVLSSNAESGVLATYGTAEKIAPDSLPAGPIFVGPGGAGLWSRSVPGEASVDQIAVTIDGGQIVKGPRLTVENATLIGDDGAGSLVFERGGSTYSSAGGDPVLLTTGELIALGTTAALIRECDEQMVCGLDVVNRVSGDRLPVGIELVVNSAHGVDGGRDVSLDGSMSPDGGIALVSLAELPVVDADGVQDGETWGFVDFATSDVVTIDVPTGFQPIVWNADSTYAVFVSDGSIRVFERSTHSVIDVTGVSDVRGIAAVDPGFRPIEPGEPTG